MTPAAQAVSDAANCELADSIKNYGIVVLDPGGRIVSWNAGILAISGYQADDIAGKHVSLFYPAADAEDGKPQQELAAAFAAGQFEDDGWRVRKDGASFWANAIVTALCDADGNSLGFASIIHDLSERKKTQALDASKTSRLVAARKELEVLSYSISHDLRAPLRHVSCFADLLRKNCYSQLDGAGQRYLDTITSSAQRMGKLIDDLLAFSRLRTADLRRTHVSLEALLEEVCRELEPDLVGRNVVWLVGDLPKVYGDHSMLRRVFANLLSNALKYSRDRQEARIQVGCAGTVGDETTIFVRDNGVGFEMRYVSKLFEVFKRLHSDEFEGSGVGLANVRHIVERHGGRVWAEGAVDCGATFYFSLRLNGGND